MQLKTYLLKRNGTIYWRTPLEFDIYKAPQVVEFKEDGPDTHFETDRKCVMDHDWKIIKAYAKLFREP